MVEKMDIEGGVTAFKSGMQVFENTTHHLEQIIEEADPPGAIGAMTQTAKVIQWNFTIITAAIVLVALAYLWRTLSRIISSHCGLACLLKEAEPRVSFLSSGIMKGLAYSPISIRRPDFFRQPNFARCSPPG